MKILGLGTERGMSLLFHSGIDFALKPILARGFSGFLHMALILVLFVSLVCKKLRVVGSNGEERFKLTRVSGYKQILFCCVGVSVFHIFLGLFSWFYWYRNAWSDLKLVTLTDFLITALAWGALAFHLNTDLSKSVEHKFSLLLRVWWGFYLFVSCYCLAVDIVLHSRHTSVLFQGLISDIVSVISGLYLCYAGLLRKVVVENNHLEEPLLNGDSSIGNGLEANKALGGDAITPFSNAGIFSLLSFSWMSQLIAAGFRKTIDLEDVPQIHKDDSVVGLYPIFLKKIELDGGAGKGTSAFKLVKGLFFLCWKEILWTGLLAFSYTIASYVGPYLIDTFVQFLSGQKLFENEGYVLVTTFFVAKVVECLTQRHLNFRLQKFGITMRSVLVTMIYNKGLLLSCQSKKCHTSGEISNFITVDAEKVGELSWYIHDPWIIFLQVGLAFYILYTNLGLAMVAALVSTIILMMINFPLGVMQKDYKKKLMESKDDRMKATTEILRNMRILKLQGWEMKFLSNIFELRNVESGWLKKYLYNLAFVSFLFWGAPSFISMATFGACMLLGIPLTSGKILSALATFRILQESIYNLPDTISVIIQTKVSLDRISDFLCLDELEPDFVEKLPQGCSNRAVEANDGTFSWNVSSAEPTLKNMNFEVLHGMRVAVCGTVGSGKSSLLSCILGEVSKISGSLKVCGSKAYVAQSPWIQSGKIVDNILFGKKMEKERYDMVLEACSLRKDLEILSFGDHTVIGERGINLSGGQKQRIQIARALYQDADIYLFDDPFSAVDAHTGSHLFKEVLLGLLSTKTVIYVTNQVEFLPAADLILVMKNGRITQAGKYSDILRPGTDFMELVGAHEQALLALDSVDAGSVSENFSSKKEDCNATSANKEDVSDAPKGQLVQDEEREKGGVGFSVYWSFLTLAYGGALVPFILLAHAVFQALQIGSNYWMAWATPLSEDVKPAVSGSKLILVYVGLSIASSFCILARSALLRTATYKTATLLFNKMHLSIFRASMSFFDSTPSGRIINRASTDQSAVEMNILSQLGSSAFSIIQLIGIIGVMSQVAWQVFIVFIPVIAACILYEQYYIPTARELARLVGVCKAPIIQHFDETISGSTTIRSFDQQARFSHINMTLSDAYSRPVFYGAGAMEWLSFRLNILSSLTFVFSLGFLISIPEGAIDPSIAGLAVTYGLNLNMLQASMIWNLCNLKNKIISVERILQYSNIPSEPPLLTEPGQLDPSWPSHGEVDIQDLQVRYAPHLPLVLRGLTCTFTGGLKTGIVGRTGSGKSTLIQTLFRIVEPTGGQIMIDGVAITSIGLHDLRSRLSIIPQDPTMFEGTVRSNMDPLEEYTDGQIWEALDKCQLGDEVRKKEGKLDSSVSKNGENWSMGQRQLVCLGRVLLKKNKVLVLDEATASVDTATDNLIQQTLRQHFTDCTVITIAHRITSVLDSDMVLLLSNGLIEEFDSPKRLLKDKSSSFSELVAEYTARSNSTFGKKNKNQ